MDVLDSAAPHLFTASQLVTAVVLGALIGYERQRRQRMAGLRTNALVALGSCAFVILGIMMPDEISPTRVAAQVVSGIGFLCAGVIMRDGFNVRGLNTAATLWCSAAVGVLVGSSFFVEGTLVALTVVAANTVLRPLASRLNREPVDEQTEFEGVYSLRVVCPPADKAHIRALLMQTMDQGPLTIRSLHSAEQAEDRVETEAELVGVGENSAAMERLVSRLSLEDSVNEVSWRFLGENQVPAQNVLSREVERK
ncbi:MgtC/SapB family protein [Aquisalimonas asiatica]|uniref:Protein MgtC n=1 Tax=Aquisalimonas asiatica TaxID=406100 RepID=A0A1H8S4T1_9GAMM|nr:MgtC/SapB family protein [Aquisalimonas asiatica]SEO73645.1 putative Mg2+ transporter-C (MgtC) family protein [Aquisalimonas asiatica]